MVISSKKIGGTASALSIPPRIRVIMTKLAPQRSSNCRKEVGGGVGEHTSKHTYTYAYAYTYMLCCTIVCRSYMY